METNENQIVGEVVAQDYRTAAVFKSYGIDFCCNGNRSIQEACEAKNIPTIALLEKLDEVRAQKGNEVIDFKTWPLDLLTEYIEKKHHKYVEAKILEIQPYLDKICQVHGNAHPELFEINEEFKAASGELAAHMKKEELVLFPYIRKMVKVKNEGSTINKPHFGTVQNPISMMQEEHDTEGDRFRKIEKLSNTYTPPYDACNTFRISYALLKEFENDLHLHIHLENNILFPASIQLEKQLN